MKYLAIIIAASTLTGCPLVRDNPNYVALWGGGDDVPPIYRENPEAPPVVPESPEAPPVAPVDPEGPPVDPEDPEDPPVECTVDCDVPDVSPACVVDQRRLADFTIPEASFGRAEDGSIPFRAFFLVNDADLCGAYKLGNIDRIEIPEPDPIYDGGARVREPDELYRFDPATGEGAWMGDGRFDLPASNWYVIVPVLDANNALVGEQAIYIGI